MSAASNTENQILYRKIKLREQNLAIAEQIANQFKLNTVTARVLSARGFLPDKKLSDFINPTLKDSLPDPSQMKNLQVAAKKIAQHINSGNLIAIASDFDVDGLTGASQLASFLSVVNAKYELYVPDRFTEGYGLNLRIVQAAAKKQAKLLVTIDYGTTNPKELLAARELGIETIVVDHHHVLENPPCDVFVNPQQQGCGFAEGIMCSAGLVWYLLIALRKEVKQASDLDLKSYLDLAALGTICDMVPLIGVNRVIAKRGLEELSSGKRIGLEALKNVAGVKGNVHSHHVGFGFGPRINAAGRMESGNVVTELFTTTDSSRAQQIANLLNRLNGERQEVEARMKAQAIAEVSRLDRLPCGIVVADEHFHTGVIGIVAQRMVETFYRPAAVIGIDQGKYKGSVRGIAGFSVVEALAKLSEFFSKYGGHTGAGGFTLKDDCLAEFKLAFNRVCHELIKPEDFLPVTTADTEADFVEMDPTLCDEIKNLGPFGIGNPGPQILVRNVKVKDVQVLKSMHLKATLTDGKRYLSGLIWNCARHPALYAGSQVNIVCKPEINNYGTTVSTQLILQAVEKC